MPGFGFGTVRRARHRASSAIWTPASNNPAVFLDPQTLSSMFLDTGGTTPAALTDRPRRLNSRGTLTGLWMQQSLSANSPQLLQNATTGAYYLESDGAATYMQSNIAVALPASTRVNIYTAFEQSSSASSARIFVELGPSTLGTAGTFGILPPAGGGSTYGMAFRSRGASATAAATTPTTGTPAKATIRAIADTASNLCQIYVNGTLSGSDTTAQGGGNYSSTQFLNLFARAGPTGYVPVKFYGLVITMGTPPADEASLMEAYFNALKGV